MGKNKSVKTSRSSQVVRSWADSGVDLSRLELNHPLVADANPGSPRRHVQGCDESACPEVNYHGATPSRGTPLSRYAGDELCVRCLGDAVQFTHRVGAALDNLASATAALDLLEAFDFRARKHTALPADSSLKVRARSLTRLSATLSRAVALLDARDDSSAGLADPALSDLVARAEARAEASLADLVRLARSSGVAELFTARALKEVRSWARHDVRNLIEPASASRRELLRPALLALSTREEFWEYLEPEALTVLAAFGFDERHVVMPVCVALSFFADDGTDVIGSAPLKRSDSAEVIETALALFGDGGTNPFLRDQLKAARALASR